MKTRLLAVAACLCASAPAPAQVPQTLGYQGRVAANGTNFNGAGQFKFALVNAAGSTNYWSNDGTPTGQPAASVSLAVTDGLFAVTLGDTTLSGMTSPVAPTAFPAADVRLRVWFNNGIAGFQQLAPDSRLAAAGFAHVAARLDPTGDVRALRLAIGSNLKLTGTNSTIAGGGVNTATNDYAMVGGGLTNTAGGFGAVVAGGQFNTAVASLAFVGGGYGNLAAGIESAVAGGELNGATGAISTVGGGYGNVAGGYASTVPGGYANLAGGSYSFAAGAGAMATNTGAFVWADASSAAAVTSASNNQWTARCAGGVRFFANSNATVGVQLAPGASAWSVASDRNLKEHFQAVDGRAVLDRLAAVPVTEWNLVSQDPSIRHIGPMAQDFRAAFGVGEDDRHISTSDADGVAFAAIQGLHELLREKDARIDELEKRLRALELKLRPADPTIRSEVNHETSDSQTDSRLRAE